MIGLEKYNISHEGDIICLRFFRFIRYLCVIKYPINKKRKAYALFDNHMDAYDFICDMATDV